MRRIHTNQTKFLELYSCLFAFIRGIRVFPVPNQLATIKALVAIGALVVAGCKVTGSSAGAVVKGAVIGVPTPGKDGEWSMPGRDYAGSRYSPLRQITSEN